MAPKRVRERAERRAKEGGRGDARQERAEMLQEVGRPLDEYDLIPPLVADIVLLGDLQDLLAQKKHVSVECARARSGGRGGHAILPAALRALDESARKLILQLVGSSTLAADALRHGRAAPPGTTPPDTREITHT